MNTENNEPVLFVPNAKTHGKEEKPLLISPTGKGTRGWDNFGGGHFGASRTKTVKGEKVRYKHKGTDFISDPGQIIKSPIDGMLVRLAVPYLGSRFSGVVIENNDIRVKMLYLNVYTYLMGKTVKQGDVIGFDQHIARKYTTETRKMTNHVHLEVEWINPERLLKGDETCCETDGCESCQSSSS
jgi:murein DD-endopeptidase MepM/ murein hydrolase activator NlpD